MLVPPRSQQDGDMMCSWFTECAWLPLIPAVHVATTACPCGGLLVSETPYLLPVLISTKHRLVQVRQGQSGNECSCVR